jgi:hypothetical protein
MLMSAFCPGTMSRESWEVTDKTLSKSELKDSNKILTFQKHSLSGDARDRDHSIDNFNSVEKRINFKRWIVDVSTAGFTPLFANTSRKKPTAQRKESLKVRKGWDGNVVRV